MQSFVIKCPVKGRLRIEVEHGTPADDPDGLGSLFYRAPAPDSAIMKLHAELSEAPFVKSRGTIRAIPPSEFMGRMFVFKWRADPA